MLAIAVACFIAISAAYSIAGPLLLIAGVLALLGNKSEENKREVKTLKNEY